MADTINGRTTQHGADQIFLKRWSPRAFTGLVKWPRFLNRDTARAVAPSLAPRLEASSHELGDIAPCPVMR